MIHGLEMANEVLMGLGITNKKDITEEFKAVAVSAIEARHGFCRIQVASVIRAKLLLEHFLIQNCLYLGYSVNEHYTLAENINNIISN